jgi:hypothetical protein
MYTKLLGIIIVGFDVTDQLLLRFVCIHQILEKKNKSTMRQYIYFMKAYDSVWRELLYYIIEFGIHMKMVRPITMWLSETYI